MKWPEYLYGDLLAGIIGIIVGCIIMVSVVCLSAFVSGIN